MTVVIIPEGLPFSPVDLDSGDPDARALREADARAGWRIMLTGRAVGHVGLWSMRSSDSSARALRKLLRPDDAIDDIDETWCGTHAGPALRVRSRRVVTRHDDDRHLVAEQLSWSWALDKHLFVLSSHTLFLMLAETVFEAVDSAAARMEIHDAGA